MSRLIRMDQTGHTTVAEWTAEDQASDRRRRLQRSVPSSTTGYYALISHGEGRAEQVRELPLDAPLVILRRPIAGG